VLFLTSFGHDSRQAHVSLSFDVRQKNKLMKFRTSFSGTWVSVDDTSTVEIRIRKTRAGYSVTAKDTFDGEVAAVSEVEYRKPDDTLRFATYWTSTGRFTRYRMSVHGAGKVEIIYTHTDSEILILKK
jgi:hypothetical protein